MTPEEIESGVAEVFKRAFGDESIVLRREMSARDFEAWDSVAHVGLIRALEKRFQVRFKLVEFVALGNVGEILDLIRTKLSEPGR